MSQSSAPEIKAKDIAPYNTALYPLSSRVLRVLILAGAITLGWNFGIDTGTDNLLFHEVLIGLVLVRATLSSLAAAWSWTAASNKWAVQEAALALATLTQARIDAEHEAAHPAEPLRPVS